MKPAGNAPDRRYQHGVPRKLPKNRQGSRSGCSRAKQPGASRPGCSRYRCRCQTRTNRPWSCGTGILLRRWLSPMTEDRAREECTGVVSMGPGGGPADGGPPAAQASEGLQGFLLLLANFEEPVELGDLEEFVNLGGDVAQHELAAGRLELLVQGDQLAQGGAGEVLDVAEVEQDLAAADLLDQAEELLADDLDVLLVENFAIDKVHDGDVTDVLDL